MNTKTNQIITHILGCVIILALPVLFSPDLSSDLRFVNARGFQRDFIFTILLVLFFYLNYFILIPELYFKKKYFLFFSAGFLSFLLMFLLIIQIFPAENMHLGPPAEEMGMRQPPPFGGFVIKEFRKFLFQFVAVFVLSLMMKINNRWKQTEKEKLNAELSYLKAQINPHFLFNTLNSIYSLAIEKSDYTATAVVKLSEMMRFVTTEANNDFVSLEKELTYISSYIELQKIRFGNTIRLIFNVEGNPVGQKIAPLILIPFVENAFKHGVNPEENSYIQITINVTENVLRMMVFNNKVNVRIQNEMRTEQGLENTKNRLHHLYPAKHLLVIDDEKSAFSVSLTINMK
jgi:hypothetical protein